VSLASEASRLLLIVVRSTVGCPAICWSGLITTPLVYFRRLFIAVFEFDVRPRNIASNSQPARLVSLPIRGLRRAALCRTPGPRIPDLNRLSRQDGDFRTLEELVDIQIVGW
jgi:hypothetical protein